MATRLAAVLGFLGVALGAFGAHLLKALLTLHDATALWQTAVFYQLVHAVACLWAAERRSITFWLWMAGIVLFSGSLYVYALTNIKWLVHVTPLGGLCFLAGWLLVVFRPR